MIPELLPSGSSEVEKKKKNKLKSVLTIFPIHRVQAGERWSNGTSLELVVPRTKESLQIRATMNQLQVNRI